VKYTVRIGYQNGSKAMSINTIEAFVQTVNKDTQLQSKVAALKGNTDRLVKLAAEAGYAFTVHDWHLAITGELSDDELNTVAGGEAVLQERPQPLLRSLVDQSNVWSSFSK
jgi:predicted ribosomally synthesized peptide with nif11-like leader